MYHGELEMRGGIVYRDTGILGDRHDDEGDECQPERHAQADACGKGAGDV